MPVEGFPQRLTDKTNQKMNYKHNPKLTGNARGLRKNLTVIRIPNDMIKNLNTYAIILRNG